VTHTHEELIAYCKTQVAAGGKTFSIYRDLLDILLGKQEDVGSLYQQAIEVYDTWLKDHVGVGVKMDGKEGKAMKSILLYLSKQSKDKTDEGILATWKFILDRWHMQNEFIGKQKKLSQINKNFLEILDNIRNGNSKATDNFNKSEKERLKRDIKAG